MLLPSKLFSYNESSLSLFVPILEKLNEGAAKPTDLARDLNLSIQQIEHALGALYALRAIDLSSDGEVFSCL